MKSKSHFKNAVDYFETILEPKSDATNSPLDKSRKDLINANNLYEEMLQEINNLRDILLNYSIKEQDSMSQKEKELFHKFMTFYATCPICNKKNHQNYLKRFYFSDDPNLMKIKNALIKLMMAKTQNSWIHVGIPCCECHDKYFKAINHE
ncbi:MAG: hypothetical protein ACTSUN_09985 [Promethearchaeota archaeon]